MRAFLTSIVAGIFAFGCAAEGGGFLGNVQDATADFILPPEQAAQLGEKMAAEIEAQQPLHPGAALQSRVSRLGQQVLAAAEDKPEAYDFSFKVLQAPDTVNAFALPGGKIYVTSGMVEMAGSDAQLASVLAHEVAHVTRRHVAERMAAQYGAQLIGGALAGDAGALTQLATSIASKGLLLKYSREQELEADRSGLAYLRQAGFDPNAAVRMFEKLAQQGAAAPTFLSTHPAPQDRVEQLKEIIAGKG